MVTSTCNERTLRGPAAAPCRVICRQTDLHRLLRAEDVDCRPSSGVKDTLIAADLCHVFPDVPGQDFVDQRLVANASTARFLAELFKHARIDTDHD